MHVVVTPSDFFFSKVRNLGIWRDGLLLILRKSYRGNPPITMAAAVTAPTTPACRLRIALSPTAPPIFPELGPVTRVGSKGIFSIVTAFVAPAVGVIGSKIENGSPVDAIPVGVAVMETSLSTNPNPAHAASNSTRNPWRRQWAERLGR